MLESIGISLFYANYGIQPKTGFKPVGTKTQAEQAIIQSDKMKELHKQLTEELEFVKQRMKHYTDRKRIKGPTFKEGSKVYLL